MNGYKYFHLLHARIDALEELNELLIEALMDEHDKGLAKEIVSYGSPLEGWFNKPLGDISNAPTTIKVTGWEEGTFYYDFKLNKIVHTNTKDKKESDVSEVNEDKLKRYTAFGTGHYPVQEQKENHRFIENRERERRSRSLWEKMKRLFS